MHIILIGAQGSGKGTQAELLAQTLNVRHVSSGDLFRKAFAEQTELGLKAKAYIDRGELVPDALTVSMILDEIRSLHGIQGALLDGFPRTVAQAQALDQGLQRIGQHVDAAVYLAVPREELLKRLSGRIICRAHQHVYNIYTHLPRVSGVCDIDGSELYQRSDDEGTAVQRRLDIFFRETVHVLDYYGAQHRLLEVNGNRAVEQVQSAILQEIYHTLTPSTHFSAPLPHKMLTADTDSPYSGHPS